MTRSWFGKRSSGAATSGSEGDDTSRTRHRPRLRYVLAAVVVSGLMGGVAPAQADAPVTTTSTGVRTHGSTTTTASTIGWLLTCPLSHRLADDPITAPGRPGGAHLHDFTGNASTNAMSTLASMTAPANNAIADTFNGSTVKSGTSCHTGTFSPGTAGDTAAYWRPTLYANGRPLTSTVKDQFYYRQNVPLTSPTRPVPQDARRIVGNHHATSVGTNPALAEGHIYWECSGDSDKHYPVPPTSCTAILQNVIFPSCWDGQAMDHRGPNGTDNNHFTYPTSDGCPRTFPINVPKLSEKFKYDRLTKGATYAMSADPGETALSPMYTAHADFWNTWNPASMQYLVTRCLNAKVSCGTNPITPLS